MSVSFSILYSMLSLEVGMCSMVTSFGCGTMTIQTKIETAGSPFEVEYDVKVYKRELPAGHWEFVRGFNSLSNDYAYTSARELAADLEKSNGL